MVTVPEASKMSLRQIESPRERKPFYTRTSAGIAMNARRKGVALNPRGSGMVPAIPQM